MEPLTLTAVATAIATIVLTKALEKTGESLGEAVLKQSDKLFKQIQEKLPKIANVIEGTEEQPLDYGEAALELKEAADADPEIAQAVQEVEAAARKDSNPKLASTIQTVEDTLKSQPTTIQIQNLAKLAEKIGVINQGTINHQTIHQTII